MIANPYAIDALATFHDLEQRHEAEAERAEAQLQQAIKLLESELGASRTN